MEHFNVSVVCHGKTPVMHDEDGSDPYGFPRWTFASQSQPAADFTLECILYLHSHGRKEGKMVMVDSGDSLTTEMLVKRILARSSPNTAIISSAMRQHCRIAQSIFV